MRSDHPNYAEGIKLYLKGDNHRLGRLLKSEKLDATEKRLVLARQALRKNGPQDAAAQLKEVGEVESRFLRAELGFVRAQIEFSGGRFEAAVLENTRALKIFEELRDRRGQFLCHYNLAVDYSRLKLALISRRHYDQAAALSEGDNEYALVERSICCELSREQKNTEAAERMALLEPRFERMGPGDLAAHLTVAFDIYLRADRFDDAQRIIGKLKRNKRGLERARLELDEALLKVMQGEPVEVSRLKNALAAHEEFRLQWSLIENLRSGALSEAQTTWRELASLAARKYGPFLEASNVEDRGQIFFAAIRALKVSVGSEKPALTGAPAYPSALLQGLFELLSQSATPLRKEEIIEKVWGVNYDPVFDTRFYKLLERFRRSSRRYSVVCANRAYSLRMPQ